MRALPGRYARCRWKVGAAPRMYRRTVLGLCSMPNLSLSSRAMRSSPHSGWSVEIRLMKRMCSQGIRGRPTDAERRRQ